MSQATPFGPSAAAMGGDATQRNLLTTCSFAYTIGSADRAMSSIFNAGFCRRVYASAAGTVFIQRTGDGAMNPYIVVAGGYIDGVIQAIGGTGTGSSAIAIVVEL